MSGVTETEALLLERVQELEERIARLEARFSEELPEVPWHVLVAAVYAVFPDGQIASVRHAGETVYPPAANHWNLYGRMEIFRSHRLRGK